MLSKKEQKFIKSLKVKKYRVREKRFLVEGTKNIRELLSSDFKVELIAGTDSFFDSNEGMVENVRLEVIKADLLAQLGNFKTNDAAIAVVQAKEHQPFTITENKVYFVLDGVGDPGNLGTIIRTLDWFGFDELICSENCAELYHPKVIASTMGSFTRMKVFYENLPSLFKQVNFPVYGADMNGENLFEKTIISNPSFIVMGSESQGLSDNIKKHITQYLSIPKFGQAESLNVGVATGILAGYLRQLK